MSQILKVNSHIHTPYSFSAFKSVEQAVKLAHNENLSALGISDFNLTDGFAEFTSFCAQYGVSPLYCMETITLVREDKCMGYSWNDANPGIMYYCYKGLDNPVTFSPESLARLKQLWMGTQVHIREMICRVNHHLAEKKFDFSLEYETLLKQYAKNTIRERHLARAIYETIAGKYNTVDARLAAFRTLFSDPSFFHDTGDSAWMQNEIRSRIQKSGKPAFVEENADAFMEPQEAREVCLDGGGIPCYPVWADDKAGLTHYEKDPDVLADRLEAFGIYFVEYIPQRNDFSNLKKYVRRFVERGFPVVFGTEHNTAQVFELEPSARGGVKFDDELQEIAWQGACMIAAHQKLRKDGRQGFVDRTGKRLVEPGDFREFANIGDEAIRKAAGKQAA